MLKHAIGYFSPNVALALLQLLSIPIFTRMLAPSEYGLFQIFNSYVSIGAVVLTMNVAASVTRRNLEPSGLDPAFTGSAVFLSVSILALLALVAAPFARLLSDGLGVPWPLLLLMFPAILSAAILGIFHSLCIAKKESKAYAMVSILRGYSGTILGIILIFYLQKELYLGPILGGVVASGVIAMFLFWRLVREVNWAPQVEHLKYIVVVSLPLMFYSIGNVILGQLDRVMINKINGPNEAGLYSVAYNIAMLLEMVSAALYSALLPYWFKRLNENERGYADDLSILNFKIILSVALAIVLFGKELMWLLAGEDFHEALHLIPVLVIAYIFNAVYKLFLREASFAKRMWHVSLVAILGSVLNFFLNLWLLPIYGFEAAAYTTLISFFVMAFLAWIVVVGVLRLQVVPVRKLFFPASVFFLGGCTYYAIETLGLEFWVAMIAKLFVGSVVVGGLLLPSRFLRRV